MPEFPPMDWRKNPPPTKLEAIARLARCAAGFSIHECAADQEVCGHSCGHALITTHVRDVEADLTAANGNDPVQCRCWLSVNGACHAAGPFTRRQATDMLAALPGYYEEKERELAESRMRFGRPEVVSMPVPVFA